MKISNGRTGGDEIVVEIVSMSDSSQCSVVKLPQLKGPAGSQMNLLSQMSNLLDEMAAKLATEKNKMRYEEFKDRRR